MKPKLETVNREEFVRGLAEANDFTYKDTYTFLDALTDYIIKIVSSGKKVHLSGFGDFGPKIRKAINGRNPNTGEPHFVPEKVIPSFDPAANFERRVEGVEIKR